MNPTTRRLLLVFALLIVFIIAAVIPIDQTVSGPCRLEPAATWYLARNGAGQITTGWERNLLNNSGRSLLMQFQRPDFVEVKLSERIRQGQLVNAGDTVAWVESQEGTGRLKGLEAELAGARSVLEGLKTGARPADVQVAEHDLERAKAAHQIAQLDFDRSQALYDSGYATLAEMQLASGTLEERKAEEDQARANVIALNTASRLPDIQAGEAEVLRLERALDTAKRLLGTREPITTPVGGIADLKGGLVDVLLRIERADTLAVIVRIPESALPMIDEELPMEVTLQADPQGVRKVIIHDYSFSTLEVPAAFAIGLMANNGGQLRSGMTGRASCPIGSRPLFDGVRARLSHSRP